MTAPRFSADQLAEFASLVEAYISSQRQTYVGRAVRLDAAQRAEMAPFFAPDVIDRVRLLALDGERVPNPDFYPMLRALGLVDLPDQAASAAVTFCDVVVAHVPFSSGLLFHELVHVEQFRQLGVARFADLYVRGFLNGGRYETIPLEVNAYSLAERFEKNPQLAFSVAEEVRTWIDRGRF
jgi:hypothetical protein